MILTSEHYYWLQRRAGQACPHEVCGFILTSGEIVEIRNVHENRLHNFKMDLQQIHQKIADINEIALIWHTHPSGNTNPSPTDLEAMRSGAILLGWDYLIVTKTEVAHYNPQDYSIKGQDFWEGFVA